MRSGPPILPVTDSRADEGLGWLCPLSENGAAFRAELVAVTATDPEYAGCVRRRLPNEANWPLKGPRPRPAWLLLPPLPPRPPPPPPPPPRPPPPPPPGPPPPGPPPRPPGAPKPPPLSAPKPLFAP